MTDQMENSTAAPAGQETRDHKIGEARKAIAGEVPPRFGMVAAPGEPTGTPAPAAIPAASPATADTSNGAPLGSDSSEGSA